MTSWAVGLIGDMFTACLGWLEAIYNRLNAGGFIVAGLIIVFFTSLFLLPLRGGHVPISHSITDFGRNQYINSRRPRVTGFAGGVSKGSTNRSTKPKNPIGFRY